LACVKANNDWMVEEWCEPSGGVNIPLCSSRCGTPSLRRAETKRNAERGVRAIAFSEMPTRLKLPSINTDYWDPLWEVCNDYGVTVCMHVGSSSSNPVASPDSNKAVGVTLGFNNAIASLADWLFSGQPAAVPQVEAGLLRGPDRLDPLRPRAGRHGVGDARRLDARQGEDPGPPSTQYYGRIFGCFTADRHGLRSLEEVGEDNICFETDYPHTDTTWPYSEAYIEKLCAGSRRRRGLQDPARQRHQDAGARPGLTMTWVVQRSFRRTTWHGRSSKRPDVAGGSSGSACRAQR
jgi:hypothetical protein